jgi:hypothetical protein
MLWQNNVKAGHCYWPERHGCRDEILSVLRYCKFCHLNTRVCWSMWLSGAIFGSYSSIIVGPSSAVLTISCFLFLALYCQLRLVASVVRWKNYCSLMQLPCSELRPFEMTHFYILFSGLSWLVPTDRDGITCLANQLPHSPTITLITPSSVKICLLFSEDNSLLLHGIKLHSCISIVKPDALYLKFILFSKPHSTSFGRSLRPSSGV